VKHERDGAGRRGEEPTPSQAKRPEKNQPTLEVGEGRGGVPPPGEQSQPHQESVANTPPTPPSRATQILDEMSPDERDAQFREWHRVEREKVLRAEKLPPERRRKALEQQRIEHERSLAFLTPEQRERYDVIDILDELKNTRPIGRRVTYMSFSSDEWLATLQKHDPELMNPIIKALNKPGRREKIQAAIDKL
jgi:hypothetical protein